MNTFNIWLYDEQYKQGNDRYGTLNKPFRELTVKLLIVLKLLLSLIPAASINFQSALLKSIEWSFIRIIIAPCYLSREVCQAFKLWSLLHHFIMRLNASSVTCSDRVKCAQYQTCFCDNFVTLYFYIKQCAVAFIRFASMKRFEWWSNHMFLDEK